MSGVSVQRNAFCFMYVVRCSCLSLFCFGWGETVETVDEVCRRYTPLKRWVKEREGCN